MIAQERVEDCVKNQWMESIWSGKTTRARTETTTTTTTVSNKKTLSFLWKQDTRVLLGLMIQNNIF